MRWKMLLAGVVIVGAVSAATVSGTARSRAGQVWKQITTKTATAHALEPRKGNTSIRPLKPWSGQFALQPDELQTLGIEMVTVHEQTEPILLEINGTTAYDPSTLTQIRARFSSIVKKVYVNLGDTVKKGDPLVELDSAELAEAKSNFEAKGAEWEHDRHQLERHKTLFQQKALSEAVYLDTLKDEQKSSVEFKLARDKLSVYGLSEAEIDNIKNQTGAQKASMTLKSPADGRVVSRDVVQDNLYDITSVLMVIAPLDHLWIKGNVYESDQHRIQIGQDWTISFPYIPGRTYKAKVEHIDARVDPTTKTIQIRTTIPNVEGRLKADMLVRGQVAIPPPPGRRRTVVPRNAMVVTDGDSYVFVRTGEKPDRFARRKVEIAKEYHDHVILSTGLEPGEVVVARGSLILSQIFEDHTITETGLAL